MMTSTRRITDCALMTAFSVILHLSTIVWGLGFVTVLLAGLPSVYVAMIHGLRWALTSTAAATMVIVITVGVFEALSFVSVFAVTGVTLGTLVRRGVHPTSVLVGTSLAVLTATIVMMYGFESLLGLDEMANLVDSGRATIERGATYVARSFGRDGPSERFIASLDSFMTLPVAILAAISFMVAYATFMAAALVLPRLGIPFEDLPDPRHLEAPLPVVLLAILDVIAGLHGFVPTAILRVLVVNLTLGSWLWLYIAGLSLTLYVMDRRGLRHPVPRLILMGLMAFPLIPLTIIAAAVDGLFCLRR